MRVKSLSYQSILFQLSFKCFILILLMFTCGQLSAQRVPSKKAFTVVIDPGHGGKDPGTVYKGIYEKNIALAIALKLGNCIKKNFPDVKVLYTRQTDIFIDLDKRAPVANKNQADLFISIHVNSNEKSSSADGTETFFMRSGKSEGNLDEVAKKENAVILYEDNYAQKYSGYDPKSPSSFIVLSLVQNTHWRQSMHFATNVQAQLNEYAKRPNRGVKQAGFLVLWRTTVPSVLIETGFLSNENDRKMLTSEHGQEVLATSIFRAFKNYKEEVESGSVAMPKTNRALDSLPVIQSDDTLAKDDDTVKESNDTAGKDEHPVPAVDFLVQIASSLKPISLHPKNFKGLKNVEEIRAGNRYKYGVGRKSSYTEVVNYSKIVKHYYPDAFVIAVKDGKIIPVKEALKEIKD